MKLNRNIPLPEPWQSYNHKPLPGFLYCRLSYAMGSGLGSWEVLVVIDPEKREYNDYVHLKGYYCDYYLQKEVVDDLKEKGIRLNKRELRTIMRLYKSDDFRKFTESYPFSGVCDSDYSTLEIYTTSDRVYLYTERFDLYSGTVIRKNGYQRSARRWTRGLRRIEREAAPVTILGILKKS